MFSYIKIMMMTAAVFISVMLAVFCVPALVQEDNETETNISELVMQTMGFIGRIYKYPRRPVTLIEDLHPGDHIVFSRNILNKRVYEHHAIIVSVHPKEDIFVASEVTSDKSKVPITVHIKSIRHRFSKEKVGTLNVVVYPEHESLPPSEVVRRATDKNQIIPYHFIMNNCEHYANEMKTGKRISEQAEYLKKIFGTVVVAVVLVYLYVNRNLDRVIHGEEETEAVPTEQELISADIDDTETEQGPTYVTTIGAVQDIETEMKTAHVKKEPIQNTAMEIESIQTVEMETTSVEKGPIQGTDTGMETTPVGVDKAPIQVTDTGMETTPVDKAPVQETQTGMETTLLENLEIKSIQTLEKATDFVRATEMEKEPSIDQTSLESLVQEIAKLSKSPVPPNDPKWLYYRLVSLLKSCQHDLIADNDIPRPSASTITDTSTQKSKIGNLVKHLDTLIQISHKRQHLDLLPDTKQMFNDTQVIVTRCLKDLMLDPDQKLLIDDVSEQVSAEKHCPTCECNLYG